MEDKKIESLAANLYLYVNECKMNNISPMDTVYGMKDMIKNSLEEDNKSKDIINF